MKNNSVQTHPETVRALFGLLTSKAHVTFKLAFFASLLNSLQPKILLVESTVNDDDNDDTLCLHIIF